MVVNQDSGPVQEVMLPYKSCKGCRDRDTKYQHIVTIKEYDDNKVSDTASTRTPDTIEDDKHIIVMDVETNGFIQTRNAQTTSNNISQFPHTSYSLVGDSIQKVVIVKKSIIICSNLMGGQ